MLELVKYIATSLVDKPEAIDVREVENEENIVIELRVDPEDMGKVIGKQCRILPECAAFSEFTLRISIAFFGLCGYNIRIKLWRCNQHGI